MTGRFDENFPPLLLACRQKELETVGEVITHAVLKKEAGWH